MKEYFEPETKPSEIRNYTSCLKKAESLGFESMTELIRETYRETGSLRAGSTKAGMAIATYRFHLKAMGEPIRPHGGYNIKNSPVREYVCDEKGCNVVSHTRDPRVRKCIDCGSRKAISRRSNLKRRSPGGEMSAHGPASSWAIM